MLHRTSDDAPGARRRSFAKGQSNGSAGRDGADLISEAFPDFRARAVPFAFDCLERQFAMDRGRVADEPQVLLLEPGTGQALEIRCCRTELGAARIHGLRRLSHAAAPRGYGHRRRSRGRRLGRVLDDLRPAAAQAFRAADDVELRLVGGAR
jgi:hypothetical protein